MVYKLKHFSVVLLTFGNSNTISFSAQSRISRHRSDFSFSFVNCRDFTKSVSNFHSSLSCLLAANGSIDDFEFEDFDDEDLHDNDGLSWNRSDYLAPSESFSKNDLDELEYELDAENEKIDSRNTMYYEESSGARDVNDILMERSLRFYDPSVTGEREKAYLVGLEARSYGISQQDKQRQDDPNIGTDEKEEATAAALQRRKDWDDRFTLEESLSELSELAGTAGLEVVGSTFQRVVEPNPRTYIGTGKVREIRTAMRALKCKTVIIDNELSPGQQRSLESEFGGEEEEIKVLDRTALILDIFAQHARTREGQLQVELALNLYRLPRLTKLWTHLERQSGAAGSGGGKSGGVGLRGPGERQLEVDRRLLKRKITELQRLLLDVTRHRKIHRRRRENLGLPIVALVGYTNSGKSTVLNSLTSASVLAEDMLFATLDPTTRRVRLPGLKIHPEIMLTDTVGFIQKLPTNLIAAFKATLEEVSEADIIVHVCDVSNSAWTKQYKAVMQVLRDLNVLDGGNVPVVTLWNKLDLLSKDQQEVVQLQAITGYDLTVAGSAKTGLGMDHFITTLEDALSRLLQPVEAIIPYSRGDLLSRIHEIGACDIEEYREDGCYVCARVPIELLNRLEPYYTGSYKATQKKNKAITLEHGGLNAAIVANELAENEWAAIARGRHSVMQPGISKP